MKDKLCASCKHPMVLWKKKQRVVAHEDHTAVFDSVYYIYYCMPCYYMELYDEV